MGMETNEISNTDDVIDSRDVIARIEELEGILKDAYDEQESEDEFEDWLNTEIAEDHELSEEAREYQMLSKFQDDAKGSSPDWECGSTLINEDYFEEYAQEFAEDIGAINKDAQWPLNHIDWEAATNELKIDYTTVDFDGVTYYVR